MDRKNKGKEAFDKFSDAMRVLLVDDDKSCHLELARMLQECGYHGIFWSPFFLLIFLCGLITFFLAKGIYSNVCKVSNLTLVFFFFLIPAITGLLKLVNIRFGPW